MVKASSGARCGHHGDLLMPISHIQSSFATGEWSPALYARVDQAKYHSAAALLRNYYVDYRGGASSRAGTKYILRAFKSATAVRLIPFQASFTVNYVLEFGDFYIRFYNNGSPVLEAANTITSASNSNPVSLNVTNTYSIGDWVFITNVVGMPELNNRYYIIRAASGGGVTLNDLNGNPVDSTTYGVYISGGTMQRVYTLASPYAASDLATLKFAQNVNILVLTQANYVPYVLTLITATNWTLLPMVIGSSISPPTNTAVTTTTAASTVSYSYVITSVDSNGQESGPSAPANIATASNMATAAGSNIVTYTAQTGAQSYNIYRAIPRYGAAVPAGVQYGFVGNTTGVSFVDTNIIADFSQTPPIPQNPFAGAGVLAVNITNPGVYTSVPTATIAAPPTGPAATASVSLGMQSWNTGVNPGGLGFFLGQAVTFPNGVVLIVANLLSGTTSIASFQPLTYPGSNPGSFTSGTPPTTMTGNSGTSVVGCQLSNVVWGLGAITVTNPGQGYTSIPAVTISSGAGTAIATIDTPSAGNPTVPGYYSQRLFLGGPTLNPQGFNFSKPAQQFNFDISNPVREDDAISGSFVSGQLNTIKSVVPMPSGLIVLCDRQAWLLNSGTTKSGIDPINIDANSQAYNGASDVPPIIANFDILYVQSKGSIVRDLTYNFYTNIFTGTDITVLSSHLFYGYTLSEWAYCEEPFKLVWAVRNDGVLLALTFMKEQELLGWTHSDTDGLFKSVASVVEQVSFGSVDALYTCVQRTIGGNVVQYIERMAERIFPNGAIDAWCVDAGLQYDGVPATSFSGGEHLAGKTIVGLADGLPITPFVMPANGTFTLPAAASVVTVGLGFTPDLQTLPIDLGEPTIQGEEKKISQVTVRVAETLGLQIGETEADLVDMDDLILGNVGKDTNEVVTDLVTGDAQQTINPAWTVAGQYFIRQPQPLPSSILGVIPTVTTGSRRS